jgi:hypothetical protein
MTTVTMNETPAYVAAVRAAESNETSAKTNPLDSWYSQPETCRILGEAQGKAVSPRWLNECIQLGKWKIERRDRPVKCAPHQKGRRPEPCYYPPDVDRLAGELAIVRAVPVEPQSKALTHAPAASGSVAPSRVEAPQQDLVLVVDRLGEALLKVVREFRKPDLGPWLTIEAAAAHSGLSETALRRAARHLRDNGSPHVALDGALKIRRGAVDQLDAMFLSDANEAASQAARVRTAGIATVRSELTEMAGAL